jgi:outer membrane receptor protein involved in Fe transport
MVYGSYTFETARIRDYTFLDPAFEPTLCGVVSALCNTLEGRRLPMSPLHRGTVGISADLPFWLQVGWNANAVGKRRLSNDFMNTSRNLKKYAIHDLHLALRPPLGESIEGTLTFAVRNLTGEKHSEFGVQSSFAPDAFFPAATRSWEVGFVLTVRR